MTHRMVPIAIAATPSSSRVRRAGSASICSRVSRVATAGGYRARFTPSLEWGHGSPRAPLRHRGRARTPRRGSRRGRAHPIGVTTARARPARQPCQHGIHSPVDTRGNLASTYLGEPVDTRGNLASVGAHLPVDAPRRRKGSARIGTMRAYVQGLTAPGPTRSRPRGPASTAGDRSSRRRRGPSPRTRHGRPRSPRARRGQRERARS